MAPTRKVSDRQMEILLEFVEKNKELAVGRYPPGPLGIQAARRLWDSAALQLNSIGSGVTKTGQKWRRYWIELKNAVKGKAADHRRMANGTGGGPNNLQPLDIYEERALAIIGRVAVEGLEGVRLPHPTMDVSPSAPTALPHPSCIEEAAPTPSTSAAEAIADTTASTSTAESISEATWSNTYQHEPTFAIVDHDYHHTPITVEETDNAAPVEETANVAPNVLNSVQNNSTTTRSRPRHANVPAWAYELEQSRLQTEQQMMETIRNAVSVLENITAVLSAMKDALVKLANK
ncbi:uncharacterized protein LOC119690864 isoform X2 [Plutella xylostella]|nr:uncharacterized protein LOC119690864 isoform X2 [Plutella xylostella]